MGSIPVRFGPLCWRSASLTSSARDLHLALGLQVQCRNDIAQFDEPVVFVRLLGGELAFIGLLGERSSRDCATSAS